MSWEIEDKQGDLMEQLQQVARNQATKDAAKEKTREEKKKLLVKTRF